MLQCFIKRTVDRHNCAATRQRYLGNDDNGQSWNTHTRALSHIPHSIMRVHMYICIKSFISFFGFSAYRSTFSFAIPSFAWRTHSSLLRRLAASGEDSFKTVMLEFTQAVTLVPAETPVSFTNLAIRSLVVALLSPHTCILPNVCSDFISFSWLR
jgi:hypothetical protein